MEEKWIKPFHTCKAVIMFGSQFQFQGHTHASSAKINSLVTCGNGSLTGTWNWALGWHIKLHARVILQANPQTILCHLCNPLPPPPLPTSFAHCVRNNIWWQTDGIFWSKNQEYQYINHVLEGNCTKKGRLKLTDTENNTVELPYIYT